MTTLDDVAAATLRIEYGASRGSGFHFLQPEIVVTNHHVIEGAESAKSPGITGITEAGERINLALVAWSPKTKHDFAILRAQNPVPSGRVVLKPKGIVQMKRGLGVLFSGFPHGIPHLLVQSATVCGLVGPDVFYLDGSINGGNSGGPIVDASDGTVVGVVTQRRFLGGADLESLADAAEKLRKHCQAISSQGSVQIMGIDMGSFSKMTAEGMLIVRQALEANANTGIGIGFSISFVAAECGRQGIV